MNYFIKFLIFIAAIIFCTTNATLIDPGCHRFLGNVKCDKDAAILVTAKVLLKEEVENAKDNFLGASSIKNNIFHISVCSTSTNSTEMYLEFLDVCEPQGFHISAKLSENENAVYTLGKAIEANVDIP
uniref:Uncharacterized protein n=1 Tax=Panagrolaimus superbus TaxID=310955 RepID=A0A914YI85_9BILA